MKQETNELFKIFLEFYYPELKSFAISYLTLVTTILVFSITFAEKVISKGANKKYSVFLFGAWFMFLLSIIFGGYGLWRLFAAANIARGWYWLYDDVNISIESRITHFKAIYSIAYRFLNYSGVALVFGIISLMLSGLIKLDKNSKPKTYY